LLKESPPVNTIKPIIATQETLIESDDSNPLPSTSRSKSSFTVGDLIWGAARGSDAWPGKVVISLDGEPTPSDCVWVKWFGGRQNTEIVNCNSLKTLSEGLEAHHAAQKDSRK
jgi:methyl-CpG-binding domain protein 5